MSGQELKEILNSKDFVLKDLTDGMGISQSGLSQMFKTQDVKSGTLEKLCDILGVNITYFYVGTKYAPTENNVQEEQPLLQKKVNRELYDRLREENLILKGKYQALEKAYEILALNRGNSSTKAI